MKRLIFAGLLALGWLFINGSLKAADILYFTSSPTSWVGHQGQTLTLTSTTASFDAYHFPPVPYQPDSVMFNIRHGSDLYSLDLCGYDWALPTVGFYDNATRWPFNSLSNPGLSFSAAGNGVNTLTGWFNVLDAHYDINGSVVSFAVDFMQYENGVQADWVSGSFRYNSNIPIPEPATLLLLSLGAAITAKRNKISRIRL